MEKEYVDKEEEIKKHVEILHKNISKNNKKTNRILDEKFVDDMKKVKERFVQGLWISNEYRIDWDFIKEISSKYNEHKLNFHSSIITINERKNVAFVDKFITEIKENSNINYKKKFELADIGYNNLFILFLRIYPEFCRQIASDIFKNWIINDNSNKYLQDLYFILNIIKETKENNEKNIKEVDEKIENFVSDIVKKLK